MMAQTMKPSPREAILAFELDEPEASFSFSRRLARENRWTPEFAVRAIDEYKRFLILCAEAGHPVTPPDAVDQVWHLHLCYTDSYWNRLCGGVLGFPLHHGPTKGGDAERSKFESWYEATWESYERIFGEAPPEDIWPSPHAHPGRQDFRRIDCASHFVLPKRLVLRGAAAIGIAGFITISLAGCRSALAEGNIVPWIWIVFGALILLVIIVAIRNGGKGGSGGGCGWFGGCGGGDSGCGGSCGGGGD